MKKTIVAKRNEPVSASIHIGGLVISIAGFVILMMLTSEHGTIFHMIGFIIFGVSLMLLYLTSAVYHFFPKFSRIKRRLRRMDHIMIYIFMAGTYTPICLTIDNRACGWGLLAVAWCGAIAGIVIKAARIKIKDWVSLLLYVWYGLLIVGAIGPVMQWLPKTGMGFLFGGGMLYLIGVIFYILEDHGPKKMRINCHAIWHVFVIAGSSAHGWLMLKYILYI